MKYLQTGNALFIAPEETPNLGVSLRRRPTYFGFYLETSRLFENLSRDAQVGRLYGYLSITDARIRPLSTPIATPNQPLRGLTAIWRLLNGLGIEFHRR